MNDIEKQILLIRGQKVILDRDLAVLYGVSTKQLNQQVKRNLNRFPQDFMFQLTKEEADQALIPRSQFATLELKLSLRSQFVTLKRGEHIKYLPYAFTEHRAVMLAAVPKSPIAIQASIDIVRAFIKLRSILGAHKELAKQLQDLEKKTDGKFKVVFELIQKFLQSPTTPKSSKIGFRQN